MDFEYDLFEPRREIWADVATRRPTDVEDFSVDHYVIENERSSASENESCNERMNEDDVSEKETRTQPYNSRDVSSPLGVQNNGTQNENDLINDLQDTGSVSNRAVDITVIKRKLWRKL